MREGGKWPRRNLKRPQRSLNQRFKDYTGIESRRGGGAVLARLGISETVSARERWGGRPRWEKGARISGQPKSALEGRCHEIFQGSASWGAHKSWQVLRRSLLRGSKIDKSWRWGKTIAVSRGDNLWRGSGLALSPAKKPAFHQGSRACGDGGNQSSPGIIKVMAGCGSSRSRGPQTAISFTSLAVPSSLRT